MSVYSTVRKLVERVFVNPSKPGEDYLGYGGATRQDGPARVERHPVSGRVEVVGGTLRDRIKLAQRLEVHHWGED